jgi:hypothetical protein
MQPKPAIIAVARPCIARGTGSSNPFPSSEESCELSVPERGVARPPIVAAGSLSLDAVSIKIKIRSPNVGLGVRIPFPPAVRRRTFGPSGGPRAVALALVGF